MIRGVEEYETGIMTQWNERGEEWKRGRGDKLKTGSVEEWIWKNGRKESERE